MLVIKKICDYTIPMFGNKRVLPYAKLLVSDGITEKLRPIIDDGGRQYITFNRKRYYIKNAGNLYSPHMEDHPEFSRNTGAGILEMVQNHSEGMKLQDSINFAADGLFCEWAWVIDLDAGTFEGYCGFGQTPLAENDRFYFLRDLEEDNGYHGVRLVAKWNLDALPTDEEFLAAFKNDEEEETPTF